MEYTATTDGTLAGEIIARVKSLLLEAEQKTKPLELDPYRTQLFELFVTAEGAGYLDDDALFDLSADGLCRELAECWGLKDAALSSTREQTRLSGEHLAKMRMLWSVMRMWMEWTYAWQRWGEFHGDESR